MPRKGHRWRKPSLAGSFLLCAMTYESIERHVREDDYFATAATILDLLQQELASRRGRRRRSGELLRRTIELLQRTRDDLLYLQEHYRIVRRRTRS
jgi:hypothetical protein